MHFRWLLHVDKFHLHLTGPPEEGRAFATGNAACTQASRVREGEALAIVCIKRLDFEGGAVVLREQSNAAGRQCPVHVHEEHFDLRSAFLECRSEFGKIGQPSLQRNREEFRLRLSLSHAQTRSKPRSKSWIGVITKLKSALELIWLIMSAPALGAGKVHPTTPSRILVSIVFQQFGESALRSR